MIQIQPQLKYFDDYFAYAQSNGLYFEALDLFLPGAFNNRDLIQQAAEKYAACCLVRSVHGAFIDVNPASGDPDIRKVSELRIEESCRIASEIGAENVVFHASAHPFLNGAYLDFWSKTSAEYYMHVSEKYGLRVYIENSADVYPDAISLLMKACRGSNVLCCLDIGHVNYSNVPIERWFECLEGSIGYLHISDNRGLFDDHIPAGSGTIDWIKADMLWKSAGSPEFITIEMNTLADTDATFNYLKQNGLFGL